MIDEKKQPASVGDADWRVGLDNELADLVQQKGWRSAKDVLASYRSLEKMMGGDRLAVPGKDAGPEAWSAIWEKLGRPTDAAGYALPVAEGMEHDGPTAQWFRDTAFELGLSQTQAQKLHDAFLARFGHGGSSDDSLADGSPEDQRPEERADLKSLWGRQYDRNMASARRAYGTFLGDEAGFNQIADGIGMTALLDLLAKVGRATAEDSITGRADARTGGPRSPAEAMSEIAKLQSAAKSDPRHAYVNKTHPDHTATVKRMEDLFTLAYGKV